VSGGAYVIDGQRLFNEYMDKIAESELDPVALLVVARLELGRLQSAAKDTGVGVPDE